MQIFTFDRCKTGTFRINYTTPSSPASPNIWYELMNFLMGSTNSWCSKFNLLNTMVQYLKWIGLELKLAYLAYVNNPSCFLSRNGWVLYLMTISRSSEKIRAWVLTTLLKEISNLWEMKVKLSQSHLLSCLQRKCLFFSCKTEFN